MSQQALIEGRFNGPLESGQGGYSSGVFAEPLGSETTEVTLRRPVPLGRPLEIERENGAARVLGEAELIAEVRALPDLDLEAPAAPSIEEARAAAARYTGEHDGMFSHCFVCGLDREDAFGVFAGPVADGELVASPWTPPAWTSDDAGAVRREFVWAVLDCPTYFACYHGASPPPVSFLGRLSARIDAPVRAETEHVVAAWPLAASGRKREAGAAVYSAEGEVLAAARAVMIEARPG